MRSRKLINAGDTSRDRSQVQKHIEELRREGIAAPRSIPAFYPKTADRITTAEKIEVLAENTTSGETEFVLLFDQDTFVGRKRRATAIISRSELGNSYQGREAYP